MELFPGEGALVPSLWQNCHQIVKKPLLPASLAIRFLNFKLNSLQGAQVARAVTHSFPLSHTHLNAYLPWLCRAVIPQLLSFLSYPLPYWVPNFPPDFPPWMSHWLGNSSQTETDAVSILRTQSVPFYLKVDVDYGGGCWIHEGNLMYLAY